MNRFLTEQNLVVMYILKIWGVLWFWLWLLTYNVEIDFQNDTKAGNLQEVQELYRKTSSIEAHQVATDLEEATGIKIQEDIEFQEIPGFMVQEILGIRNYQNSSCVTIGRKYFARKLLYHK